MNENISPEDNFLDPSNIGRAFVLSIGAKRQGKTYHLCQVIKYCIANNIFEEYHLILPEFQGERDDKYAFLKDVKNVFIYSSYAPIVSKKMLSIYENKHIMFAIDDASGEFLGNIDEYFIKFATRNEHKKKACIWLNVHSCKKVLSPIIRQQITNMFIFKISNYKLLRDIYEEYFQMLFPKFEEFMQIYTKNVILQKNNAIMYALDGNHELENGIHDWKVMTFELPSKKVVPVNENEKENENEKKNNSHPLINHLFRRN